MLVVLEVKEVVRFPADGNLGLSGYFHGQGQGGPLNDAQRERACFKCGLELVGPHLNDHTLSESSATW